MKAIYRSPYWPRAGYVEELCMPHLNGEFIEATATAENLATVSLNAVTSSREAHPLTPRHPKSSATTLF